MHARWANSNLSKSEIYLCEKEWKVNLGQGRAAAGKECNAIAKCIAKCNAFCNTFFNAIFKCNTNTNTFFNAFANDERAGS